MVAPIADCCDRPSIIRGLRTLSGAILFILAYGTLGGNLALLEGLVLRCLGTGIRVASTICLSLAAYPAPWRYPRNASTNPCCCNWSQNSQTVLASGTVSSSPSPRNCMNDSNQSQFVLLRALPPSGLNGCQANLDTTKFFYRLLLSASVVAAVFFDSRLRLSPSTLFDS